MFTWQDDPDSLDAVPEGPVVDVEDGIGLHQDAGGAVLGVQGVDGAVVLGGVSGVVDPWNHMKKERVMLG